MRYNVRKMWLTQGRKFCSVKSTVEFYNGENL